MSNKKGRYQSGNSLLVFDQPTLLPDDQAFISCLSSTLNAHQIGT